MAHSAPATSTEPEEDAPHVITFDTGAIIAVERRTERMLRVMRMITGNSTPIIIPAVALAEWWRARPTQRMQTFLTGTTIEPVDATLASAAGEALAALPTATIVDALVMASAARSGGIVYTSDVGDLMTLQTHFRTVRVLAV